VLERRLNAPIGHVASSSAAAEEPRQPRSLHQRLTPTQIDALVAAYRAGVRQPVLAERYGDRLDQCQEADTSRTHMSVGAVSELSWWALALSESFGWREMKSRVLRRAEDVPTRVPYCDMVEPCARWTGGPTVGCLPKMRRRLSALPVGQRPGPVGPRITESRAR
jgi:hypothetical protein